MKNLCDSINESTWSLNSPVVIIGDTIDGFFKNISDKQGAEELLEAIEEAMENTAIRLEMDEKDEVLKAFEIWAKKHKFDLN